MNVKKIFHYLKKGWQKNGLKGIENLARNYWVLKKEPEIVDSELLSIVIEPTIRCNLNCITCSEPARSRTQRDMDFEEFKNIINQFPYLIKLALQGVGEPLLNKDLFKMIRLAKERQIYVYFNSNGTVLNEEISYHLIQSGLDLVNFSVDGGTKEVYEKIRTGASFEKFCEKVKGFLEIKGKHSLPETNAWFVLNRYNIDNLMATVQLVKRLGFSKLYVQRMHTWGRGEKQNVMINDTQLDIEARKRAIETFSKETGILVDWLWDVQGEEDTVRRCQSPWYTAYITVEGYVTPCCVNGSDPQLINFGSLKEKPFKEIWNSEEYQEFRKALRSKHPPSICKDCPGYSQRILE